MQVKFQHSEAKSERSLPHKHNGVMRQIVSAECVASAAFHTHNGVMRQIVSAKCVASVAFHTHTTV